MVHVIPCHWSRCVTDTAPLPPIGNQLQTVTHCCPQSSIFMRGGGVTAMLSLNRRGQWCFQGQRNRDTPPSEWHSMCWLMDFTRGTIDHVILKWYMDFYSLYTHHLYNMCTIDTWTDTECEGVSSNFKTSSCFCLFNCYYSKTTWVN